MDPVQSALSAFLNAISATQATQGLQAQPASSQTALAALLGQDVNLIFQGAGKDGLLFTLPGGQTLTAQGEFPYPEGTQVLARVAPGPDAGAVRLLTLQTQPPAPPAILAPLLQGEAQVLQARLTQANPPSELEPLVALFRSLGGALPAEAALPESPATPATPPPSQPPQTAQPQAAGEKAAPAVPQPPESGGALPASSPAAQRPGEPSPQAAAGRAPDSPEQAVPGAQPAPQSASQATPALVPGTPTAAQTAAPMTEATAAPTPPQAPPPATVPAPTPAEVPAAPGPPQVPIPLSGTPAQPAPPPGTPAQPAPPPGTPTQPAPPPGAASAPPESAPPAGELLRALAKDLPEPASQDASSRAVRTQDPVERAPQPTQTAPPAAQARMAAAADAAPQAPKAALRATQASTAETAAPSRPGAAPGADPESWVSWVKAGVRALSDPAVSPREAPFHQAQGRDGTALYELPLPWSPQTPLQMWVESDGQGKGKGGKGGGTTRVLLGMSFSRLGETRLGIAKGPEGLQVRVWAQHPEALAAAQGGMEEELRSLGTPVDLKILPLEPGPGGAIPSIRSLATGSTFQVLG